ncbi:MAG: thioredoxin family protein [Candidatus Omnitrophota bacterium]
MVKIEILGVGCPKCKQLAANTQAAAQELNIQVQIEKITDIDRITEYGVMITPALAINGKVISAGKLLSTEEIKKLLS